MAKKQRQSVVAVVDIGSTKVVCFIAKFGGQKQMQIVGIGHHIARGIKSGRITDLKEAENSIASAVEAAEKMAGQTVSKVYVTIASNNLLSQMMTSDLIVTGHEINDKDLNRLLFQLIDKYNDQDLEVIHSFAYDYILDGNRGITNPLGMYGNHLSAILSMVATPRTYLLNIANCLAKCQLEVANYVSASYASALAVLSEDEMQLGVTLIEFGGGCTSISIFNKGQMIYTDALAIGGMHVSNDIARGLATDYASAERVKMLLGTTIVTSNNKNDVFELPIAHSGHDVEMNVVYRSTLTDIIRARVEETLEILLNKLKNHSAYQLCGNKIVITGGAAQLTGMKELVAEVFAKTVRIGYPKAVLGSAESTNGVAFSTAIGMLFYVLEAQADTSASAPSNKRSTGFFGGLLNWFKENFS